MLAHELEGWEPYDPGRGIILLKGDQELNGRGPNLLGLTDLYEVPIVGGYAALALRGDEIAHKIPDHPWVQGYPE
ncbi:MAG: hypothetical protein ACXABY_20090 [Candidatus Thorarchaeota archaeon]